MAVRDTRNIFCVVGVIAHLESQRFSVAEAGNPVLPTTPSRDVVRSHVAHSKQAQARTASMILSRHNHASKHCLKKDRQSTLQSQ